MLAYLIQGVVLGFAAGISPGPMLGLLISQSLRRGWRAGSIVALAPLLTDIPIILLMVTILSHLPASALYWLSILGGAFVLYLGIETIRTARTVVEIDPKENPRRVFLTALATNFLNPHPYLFWATVGSALLLQSYTTGGLASSAAFLIGMYALLVGTKLVIAFLISRSRAWLTGRTYHLLLIGSGLLLLGLGLLLGWEGLQHIL